MKSIDRQRQQIIKRLHNIEDTSILEAVEQVLNGVSGSLDNYELTDAQKQELDKRRERHMQGSSKSYSLEEVSQRIFEGLDR